MAIGSGISFSVSGVLQALSNLSTTVVGRVTNTIASLVGPYRPSAWAGPAVTSITVAGSAFNQSSSGAAASLGQLATPGTNGIPTFSVVDNVQQTSAVPDTMYVFDAVLQVEHTQEMQVTEHPVQTGANIVDHAFAKPARIVMDIGMSDVMSSYILGQWTGAASKSVNAYQTMLLLEKSRTPVQVNARLNNYPYMLITSIHVKDDNKTKFGLRATITFQQLFMAQVQIQSAVSARPQDTTGTTGGTTPTTPVPDAVTNNYAVPVQPPSTPIVTGSGDFSSNPINADTPGFS
jgi:hypothetical protein